MSFDKRFFIYFWSKPETANKFEEMKINQIHHIPLYIV